MQKSPSSAAIWWKAHSKTSDRGPTALNGYEQFSARNENPLVPLHRYKVGPFARARGLRKKIPLRNDKHTQLLSSRIQHGGATTTGPDATYPPAICQNSGGGGGGGRVGGGPAGGRGGPAGGGSGWGSGGGPTGGLGGSCRGSGGGLAGGQGGVGWGEGGGLGLGLGLRLGSPSWWNQSWFYNPF